VDAKAFLLAQGFLIGGALTRLIVAWLAHLTKKYEDEGEE
jgi:hypothetical protein